jgi:hypothetical protein
MKTFNDFIFEFNNFDVLVQVDNIDENFKNEIINNLSFLYKKRIDRYLRPTVISGDITDNFIQLNIIMSNKDIINIEYINDELKIIINDELIYYMDEINYNEIINKVAKNYKKYIEKLNFNILTKNNDI